MASMKNHSPSTSRSRSRSSLTDELPAYEKGAVLDLGHPLLNRMVDSFLKAAGIGAIQAVSSRTLVTAKNTFKGSGVHPDLGGVPSDISNNKKHRLPYLTDTIQKSLEAMVKSTGKESLQWGLAAGMYSGLTYGLEEFRGSHDWKNSAIAGAVTGAALALTSDEYSHEQIAQFAITGAAISTAANLLAGIF